MKKCLYRSLSFLLTFALLISLSSCREKTEPLSGGIPYEALAAEARIPWDLAIHQGYLYVGAGDYGRNISPQVAMRAPLTTLSWEAFGNIPDEQINRFLSLGEAFVIPGTDPTGGWEMGSYYLFTENGFEAINTVPSGVHVFDMALYDGKLFAALGVDGKHFPTAVSHDGGNSFEALPLILDNSYVLVEKSNRVYDLFCFGDSLYALYHKNLFVYTEEPFPSFAFVASWEDDYELVKETYVPILAKCVFQDKLFFTTENLYVCENENGAPSAPSPVELKHCDAVMDITVANGTLYLLTYEKTWFDYEISVLSSTDGETFEALLSFSYNIPAVSLAYDGSHFYLGMGKINDDHKQNGEILKVTVT